MEKVNRDKSHQNFSVVIYLLCTCLLKSKLDHPHFFYISEFKLKIENNLVDYIVSQVSTLGLII